MAMVELDGVADDVIIDNHASGLNGGTITVNTNPTILSINMTTMTGTLDFATNNNSITLSAATAVSLSGTSTRTLNMGDGTWTLSNNAALWSCTTVTNLTLNANGSTIAFTGTGGGTSSRRVLSGTGKTYNIISFASGSNAVFLTTSGTTTINTLTISPGNTVFLTNTGTHAIGTMTDITGSSSAQTVFCSDNPTNGRTTLSTANNWNATWCGFSFITAAGGGTVSATDSYDFKGNSGTLTITPPTLGSGGVVGVIGG